MTPAAIHGATRRLGAPAGWDHESDGPCGALLILDVPASDGAPSRMVSAWEPTEAERLAIATGGYVFLSIVGTAHPPVWVWAEPLPSDGLAGARHNEQIHSLLKQIVEGRTAAEAWVFLETLALGVGMFFGNDPRQTAEFLDEMARRIATGERSAK